VKQLAAGHLTVVENEDGVIAFEMTDRDGQRIRLAVLDQQTGLGTEVLGLVFMDEADVRQLEEMEKRHETGLLRPDKAEAHYQDRSHYHYFWNGSWVYNQGGTYGISFRISPLDAGYRFSVGSAIAGLMGVAVKHPLLGVLGGFLIDTLKYRFTEPDGSMRGSISDYRSVCGYVLWNTGPNPDHWLWYYCAGTVNYGYARDYFYSTPTYYDLTP
jgi:hypothetical protein